MKWGNWMFDSNNLALIHADGYTIHLNEVDSSAEILDWIFQIQQKSWADASTMHDLLSAFDAVLRPQAHYCSEGKDKRADGGKLARLYAERMAR